MTKLVLQTQLATDQATECNQQSPCPCQSRFQTWKGRVFHMLSGGL